VLNRKQLEKHLPALIKRLGEADLDDAIKLDPWGGSAPELDWYRKSEIRVRWLGRRKDGGRVAVLPDATGGAVDERLEGITEWVHSVRTKPWWTTNVGKLAASGYTELHFAVVLHESGVPFELSSGFWSAETIAAPALTDVELLTDLWLITPSGRYVAHWSRESGWLAHARDG
jgi:hypothetical protein